MTLIVSRNVLEILVIKWEIYISSFIRVELEEENNLKVWKPNEYKY